MKNNNQDISEAGKYKRPVFVQSLQKGDFILCQSPTSTWICIVSHIQDGEIHYFVNYNYRAKLLRQNDWFLADYAKRKATQDEKRALWQVLDKENLVWIGSCNKIVNFNAILLVPEAITLLKPKGLKKSDKHIGICTTDGSKVMYGAGDTYGLFYNDTRLLQRAGCLLIPCSYSDFESGDTAFRTKYRPSEFIPDLGEVRNYVKIQKRGYSYISGESLIKCYDRDYYWFKVTMG